MVLAQPGQLAEIGFVTCEFVKTGTSPRLLAMLDEIADSVTNISAASQSGQNTTYTYTLTSGYPLTVNSDVAITGMADAGNNGTFVVTAVGAGTFTVVNPTGVTRAGQTGAGTLFEDLSGYVTATGIPPQDAPWIFGWTTQPVSTYSNRYYFSQTVGNLAAPQGTFCRHMQIKIDFGATDTVQNEILSQTVSGHHWAEL